MGTRSLVHIKSRGSDSDTLVTIYRQFDGYPDGMGSDLKEAVGHLGIVNGFTGSGEGQANGMGCLAAQLIVALKDCVGNVYIYPHNSLNVGEEYVYTLWEDGGKCHVLCESTYGGEYGSLIYRGPLCDWDCTEPENEDA